MFQLDNATVTIYAVASPLRGAARHKLRQLNALQVKQMSDLRALRRNNIDSSE